MAGVDAQGNLTYGEYNEYDPYGKPEAGSSTVVKNDVKYMGGVSDASGLYYLNARHYDANTGRFLQQDTYKGNPYAPWTQNLYAYCNNNPTSFIDPPGHIAVIDEMVKWLKENTQRLIEINFENNVRAHAQSQPEWQSATTQEKKRIENRTRQDFNTILKSAKEVRTVTDNTRREGFNILFRESEGALLQYGETQASQTGRVAPNDIQAAQAKIREGVGLGVVFEGMTHGHHDDLTAYEDSKHYLSLDDMNFSTSWLEGNLYVVNKSGYVEGFDYQRYLADGGKPIDEPKFIGDMYNEQAKSIYAKKYAPYIFKVGSIH